jgi:H+-transporting ATPase
MSKLVVFLALFADVATIAIAYDKAPYAPRPVEWQLPKIWVLVRQASSDLACSALTPP